MDAVSGHITASVPRPVDWHPLTVHAYPRPTEGKVRYEGTCGCGQWQAAAVGTGVRGAAFISSEHLAHRRNVT